MFDLFLFDDFRYMFHFADDRHAVYLHPLFRRAVIDECDRIEVGMVMFVVQLPGDHRTSRSGADDERPFLVDAVGFRYVTVTEDTPSKARTADQNDVQHPSDKQRT